MLFHSIQGCISLSQKLIDVQQTLIRYPNPIENRISFNPGKTKKSDISQLLVFIQYLRKIIIQRKPTLEKERFLKS